jgi:acyl carrier protein
MMVTEALVLLEIRRVVERELTLPKEVKTSDRLVDDLGLDSLTLTTLAVELEDRFQILLSDDVAARIVTVGELVDLVIERARAAAAAHREAAS